MLGSASVGSWRSRLATMVDFKEYVRSSKVYSVVLTILTFVSFLPLCFKQSYPILELIQWPIMIIFILDYFARWVTADIRSDEYSGIFAFVHYPLEFWAIVDLLSILSFVTFLPTTMRLVRLLRLLRLLLVVSLLRYSRGFYVLFESINREKRAMGAVMGFLLGYILLIALIMFNVETTEFETFFDASFDKMYGFEFRLAEKLGYLQKEKDGSYKMTHKGAFYYHYYEQYYTLAYIDKMWGIMKNEAFPEKIEL